MRNIFGEDIDVPGSCREAPEGKVVLVRLGIMVLILAGLVVVAWLSK